MLKLKGGLVQSHCFLDGNMNSTHAVENSAQTRLSLVSNPSGRMESYKPIARSSDFDSSSARDTMQVQAACYT